MHGRRDREWERESVREGGRERERGRERKGEGEGEGEGEAGRERGREGGEREGEREGGRVIAIVARTHKLMLERTHPLRLSRRPSKIRLVAHFERAHTVAEVNGYRYMNEERMVERRGGKSEGRIEGWWK